MWNQGGGIVSIIRLKKIMIIKIVGIGDSDMHGS